jgi:hypothetical protein
MVLMPEGRNIKKTGVPPVFFMSVSGLFEMLWLPCFDQSVRPIMVHGTLKRIRMPKHLGWIKDCKINDIAFNQHTWEIQSFLEYIHHTFLTFFRRNFDIFFNCYGVGLFLQSSTGR